MQYEGEELSKNVFYTGAAPNQQAIPAVEYLMSKEGGGAKRWVLLGTDYVYPRTTNKILRAFLKSKGVDDKDIDEKYTPFGHSDYQTIVADIKKFAAGGKTAVVSTINGDSNVPFYKELGNQGLKATDVPVVAFSVGEEELRGVDTKPLVGHLAAWNYFMSLKNPANDAFKKKWADYAKAKKLPGADKPLTNDPMEATYVGMWMWKQAVEKAKSTDTDKVVAAMAGQKFNAPDGFDDQDGRKEPPSVEAGADRRNPGQRPVQRRLEDEGPGARAAVEPVHRRQREEEGRAGKEVGKGWTARRRGSGSSGSSDRGRSLAPVFFGSAFGRRRQTVKRSRWPFGACVRWVAALAIGIDGHAAFRRCPPTSCTTSPSARATRKAKAIGALVADGDPAALPLLQAMIDGEVQTVGEDRVLIVKGDTATDAVDRQGGHAAARQPRRRRRQQPAAAHAGHGDRGVQARRRPIASFGSPRRRNCRTAPTRTRCRRSPPRPRRNPTPRSRAC